MMFNFKKTKQFLLDEKILSKKECEIIKNIILDKESYIKSLGPDIYGGTAPDSLTGRFPYFNFLTDPEIEKILIPKLKIIFKKLKLSYPISVQCWANIFRYNEGISWHKHSSKNVSNFICSHIFISGNENPGTTYLINDKEINCKNKVGKITIFDCNLSHCVYPNVTNDIRISLAMDIHENVILNDKRRYFCIH